MERSLDPELLELALGPHASLPSAESLAALLTQAELGILAREPIVSEELRSVGWYLHGIASSRVAQELYGIERQRAAFQVAGHIFDLYLNSGIFSESDRLKYCFAAQIAYLRGDLTPNATAIYHREFDRLETTSRLSDTGFIPDYERIAISLGVALLGFNVGYIFDVTRGIIRDANRLARIWEVDTLAATPFGAALGVVSGVRDIMSFLVYGRQDLLNRARGTLRNAITADASLQDHTSRWVAAHLLNIGDGLEQSSVWTVLPPEVPPAVRRAFVAGKPSILTLWPAQLEMLNIREPNIASPLSTQVRRLIISTPTSSGKTTISQLLITSHLATESTSVCYVAPTRSLCREVRRSLERRLRFLSRYVIDGLPDDSSWDTDFDTEPSVEVMTPERLSFLVRQNPSAVLARFGMFIFDEVHLIGETNRGWTLESILTFLHHATAESSHRIVLISAAIGNRNHFVQWMSLDASRPLESHSEWRGPRRLSAIYSTQADWSLAHTETKPRATRNPVVERTPLYGLLQVAVAHSGAVRTLRTADQVGVLVRTGPNESNLERSADSTPFYRSLIPLITHLAESGPVLVIEPTKVGTLRMARAIAENRAEEATPASNQLVDLIEAHIGRHPLCDLITKGVAYHHGSLPSSIRAAIEDATSHGIIRILVATTTMTDGVNLPVQSVVISAQGSYGRDGFSEYITGPKLINAIGRAGRATKETEGIVVLARNAAINSADFERLNPDTDAMTITSMLAQQYALAALAQYESERRNREDAAFEVDTGPLADFMQFAWFIASELERVGEPLIVNSLETILHRSLGWLQLSGHDKMRWLSLADNTLRTYQRTTQSVRRRWAGSGIAIRSARQIEAIATELASVLSVSPLPAAPDAQIAFIFDENRLGQLCELADAPNDGIFNRRAGRGRTQIHIPLSAFIVDWVRGTSLNDLAERYLGGVPDIDFRYEQLSQFLNTYFETYLPHVLAVLIQWTNELCAENNCHARIPPSLTGCLRYGVNTLLASQLIVNGLESRTLANRVAQAAPAGSNIDDVREWIRTMDIPTQATLLHASPFELRSLMEFARPRTGGVAYELFRRGFVLIELPSLVQHYQPAEANLRLREERELSPVEILVAGVHVGDIPTPYAKEVIDILETGIQLRMDFSAESSEGLLRIEIVSPDHGF